MDNTLPSPLLAQPIEWGADIVTTSLTKFINGRGDLISGAVIDAGTFNWRDDTRYPALSNLRANGIPSLADSFNDRAFAVAIRQNLTLLGPAHSPGTALKIIENMADLDTRIERHVANTVQIASFLRSHPAVEWTHYAGFEDHPTHDLGKKYLSAAPSMLTFKPKGGLDSAQSLVQAFRHIRHEVNIGYHHTLVAHPFGTTHRMSSPEQRAAARVEPGVLRLSIGTEDPQVIVDDLNQAFRTLSIS